jgi:hypothetical protein
MRPQTTPSAVRQMGFALSIPASTLGVLLIPALPFAAPWSEVSLARISGLGARRVGRFIVVVSILPPSSADDGPLWTNFSSGWASERRRKALDRSRP